MRGLLLGGFALTVLYAVLQTRSASNLVAAEEPVLRSIRRASDPLVALVPNRAAGGLAGAGGAAARAAQDAPSSGSTATGGSVQTVMPAGVTDPTIIV